MRNRASAQALRPFGPGLILIALCAAPWAANAAPKWCSPFESESGQPVTTGQIAGPVANVVGSPGQSNGGATNLDPILYVKHGELSPAIPAAIDPAGQAAQFGVSTPDNRGTGINTNVRSDAGDLTNHLTFEGYFFMPNNDPVLNPTFVGRRLATQKRGETDDSSRLAIGIHATRTGVVDGLFDYEGFNYEGTALEGQSGGIGFAGPWTNATTFPHLSNDGVSLNSDIFPFAPVGSRISGTGGTSARALSRSIDLGAEGTVTYLSALISKTSTPAGATGHNLEIGLANSPTVGGTSATIRIGMTSGHRFFLTNSNAPQGNVTAGVTYFVVVKIISHASTADECFMQVYAPGEAVGATEPTTWTLTHSLSSSAVLTHLRMTFGANLNKGEIDEIRLGSTFASVVDPQAPLGNAGVVQNLLSTYWAEAVPPVPPAVLPTYINHLEFGTTPLAANTWYHFALTYDGSAIRWYLNGQQQGEVVDPPLAPAGTAKMVLANNRMTGVSDRGFYGLLDEFRIWDKTLAPSAMLVNGGLPGEGLLWRSRFETQFGAPVSTGLEANALNCFANSAGPPDGSPAGIVASTYAAYGETNVPAIPASIDPANLRGSFVLSLPDLPVAAVNTNVQSNVGNFASALTAQGYFNTFRTTPVGVNSVAMRLVSTMRSSAQGTARLAIGLSPNVDVAPTHNVLSIIWSDPDAVLTIVRGTTPVQANTWYHFAMVWDGTDIRFYLNGTLEGEVLGANLIAPGSATMVVGNDRATAGTRGFYGLLDKIVISDHVLPPAEFLTTGFDACLGAWCNVPFADADDDGDVDMDDFAIVQRCVTLSGVAMEPACVCFDRDDNAEGDGDVDLLDIDEFLKCATGPSIPWSPGLLAHCNP